MDRIERAAVSQVAAEPEERESFWRQLDPEQSLNMERSHLWVRVSIFILPLALLVIFGRPAAGAALICAVCVFGSFGLIVGGLRFWPDGIRHGQIALRVIDVILLYVGISQVQIVMLRQTGSFPEVFDMLYVLPVMSSVANSGLGGGLIVTVASSIAIVLDRLMLVSLGLVHASTQMSGQLALSIVTYVFMFAVSSSTVFYLMQVSAMLATRRERALSAVIAADNVELERANETLKARRRMTADIAHELRSPLTTISAYSEAICTGMLPASEERLAAIFRQAKRLDGLIGDLRLLSLADIGALTLTMGPVLPDDLVQRTLDNFTVPAEERGVGLSSAVDGPLPAIEGDMQRLEQVLGNLVSNALRHTQPGGSVRLTGRVEYGQVVLSVEDSGEGIAPDELPLVFDRLYRAGPEAKRDPGGSGLGLAIVKSLVSAHGGAIDVASTLGVGTTFTIRLPISADAPVAV
jgi:signal transduction histidine kinase